jgi:hypothetical protein
MKAVTPTDSRVEKVKVRIEFKILAFTYSLCIIKVF